jgi:hypothetical protein
MVMSWESGLLSTRTVSLSWEQPATSVTISAIHRINQLLIDLDDDLVVRFVVISEETPGHGTDVLGFGRGGFIEIAAPSLLPDPYNNLSVLTDHLTQFSQSSHELGCFHVTLLGNSCPSTAKMKRLSNRK